MTNGDSAQGALVGKGLDSPQRPVGEGGNDPGAATPVLGGPRRGTRGVASQQYLPNVFILQHMARHPSTATFLAIPPTPHPRRAVADGVVTVVVAAPPPFLRLVASCLSLPSILVIFIPAEASPSGGN